MMTVMYLAQLVSVMVAIRVVIKVGPAFAYRAAISLFITGALLYGLLFLQRGGGVNCRRLSGSLAPSCWPDWGGAP